MRIRRYALFRPRSLLIDPSVSLSIESSWGVTSRMSLVRENVLIAVLDDIVTVVRAAAHVVVGDAKRAVCSWRLGQTQM